MAGYASGNIEYLLSIPASAEDSLATVRYYSNLKVSKDEGLIWVKDFTAYQLNTVEVKSLPFKQVYVVRDNMLFAEGNNLPSRKAPVLMWTPIIRAIQITLPVTNSNFFGLKGTVINRLITSERERPSVALTCSFADLSQYAENGYESRLDKLEWVILDNGNVLIKGIPLLPIPGSTYWLEHNFLIPTGYEFEFDSLNQITDRKINPSAEYWIMWHTDNSFSRIEKAKFRQLSLSSVRGSAKGFLKTKS